MKILADTNIWIHHFKHGKPDSLFSKLLVENRIVMHSYVFLELACGDLGKKKLEILKSLSLLDRIPTSSEGQQIEFILGENLAGSGLSFVDIELLLAALSTSIQLWTHDKKLALLAEKYGRGFSVA